MCVANVGQVIGFGLVGNTGIFDFDKVSNVHFIAQFGTRAQTRVGTNDRLFAHGGIGEMGIGFDTGTRRNTDVVEHAIWADGHPIAQGDLTLKHTANIDGYICATVQRAAQIDPGGIEQLHTFDH